MSGNIIGLQAHRKAPVDFRAQGAGSARAAARKAHHGPLLWRLKPFVAALLKLGTRYAPVDRNLAHRNSLKSAADLNQNTVAASERELRDQPGTREAWRLLDT
jgi:hypothetical protein